MADGRGRDGTVQRRLSDRLQQRLVQGGRGVPTRGRGRHHPDADGGDRRGLAADGPVQRSPADPVAGRCGPGVQRHHQPRPGRPVGRRRRSWDIADHGRHGHRQVQGQGPDRRHPVGRGGRDHRHPASPTTCWPRSRAPSSRTRPSSIRPTGTTSASVRTSVRRVSTTADNIYNGAWDNASGTIGVLEMARQLKAAPAPETHHRLRPYGRRGDGPAGGLWLCRRSGLSAGDDGRRHQHRHAAAVGSDPGPADLRQGPERSGGQAAGPGRRPRAATSPTTASRNRASTTRSDHFPFVRAGVPALMTWHGVDLDEGGVAVGKPAYDAKFRADYHKVSDEWSADLGPELGGREPDPAVPSGPGPGEWRRMADLEADVGVRRDAGAQRRRAAVIS